MKPWTIYKNVPIPPAQNGRGRTGLNDFLRAMEVDDFILVPHEDCTWTISRISSFHQMNDQRFTTRKMAGGLGVWRVE